MGERTRNHYTKEFKFKGQKTEQDPAVVSEELVNTIGHQTIQID